MAPDEYDILRGDPVEETPPVAPVVGGDLTPSFVRTIVPIVVGVVLSWALRRGLPVDWINEGEVTAWLTPVVTGLYYVIVRWLEQHVPAAGWLLGLAKQPGYSDAPAPPAQPAPESTVVTSSGTSTSTAGEWKISEVLTAADVAEKRTRAIPIDRAVAQLLVDRTISETQGEKIIKLVKSKIRKPKAKTASRSGTSSRRR